MTFNEFTQRLERCHLDEQTKYLLSHMFEVQVEFSRHLDIATTLIGQLMTRIEAVLGANEGLMERLKELQQRGMIDGVSVRSESND